MTARPDGSHWSFSADKVIDGTKAYPAHVRDAVRSLYHFAMAHNLSMDDVADGIGYHRANVHKLCNGRYDGDLDAVAEAIGDYLKEHPVDTGKRPLFVETDTSRKIWEVAQAVWDYQTIGAVWGDSQIGKTHALEEFRRRHAPGTVKYIRMPASAGRMGIVHAFAEAFDIPARKGLITTVASRVYRAVTSDHLVIIDEFHEPFLTYHANGKRTCMEMIRELFDRAKCGMLICGTNVGRDQIEDGPLKGVLEQLRRRCIFTLQLPKYASTADLNAIAAHYELPRLQGLARELATAIIQRNGLRAYCIHLDSAKQIASNRGEPMSWDHFTTAHDIIANYSQKKGAQ